MSLAATPIDGILIVHGRIALIVRACLSTLTAAGLAVCGGRPGSA